MHKPLIASIGVQDDADSIAIIAAAAPVYNTFKDKVETQTNRAANRI
jgi:hypothetical protein